MKAGDIMPRGGKRDGAGRKAGSVGRTKRDTLKNVTIRMSEELEKKVEEVSTGETKAEKFRYAIERGIEIIQAEKEDNQGE